MTAFYSFEGRDKARQSLWGIVIGLTWGGIGLLALLWLGERHRAAGLFFIGPAVALICLVRLTITVVRYRMWPWLVGVLPAWAAVAGLVVCMILRPPKPEQQLQNLLKAQGGGVASWSWGDTLSWYKGGHPTDAELKQVLAVLAKCPKWRIQFVSVKQGPLTDEGLQELAALEELQELKLEGTRVAGTGFRRLAALRDLVRVDLTDSPVTDEGLAALAELPALHELTLWNAAVTNQGLKHLAGLKRLRHLGLRNCPRLSSEAIDGLRAALPGCKIEGPW